MRCGAAAAAGRLLLPRAGLLLLAGEQACDARNLDGNGQICACSLRACTARGVGCHTWSRTSPGVCNALSLEIKANSKVQAFIGEQVSLKCSFRSSSPITESLTVDWTYQPLTGGQMETIFHYQSVPYPTTVGKFKGRISWLGNVAKGDASIAIQSPAISDNGTFICSVKNPPDVYHNIPQTMLIVTERGLSFQLTSAALLSILVFLPSIIVVVLLLVRMGRKFGVLKEKKKPGCKKSSIEVSDEPEQAEPDSCLGKLKNWCLNCVDTDEEDPY